MFEEITFDICQHFETGRDFGFGSNPNGFSVRSHPSNTQCHAKEDGKSCRRNGKCIIARNASTWEPIGTKPKTNPKNGKGEWVFERSSGYAGFRCMKCSEWIYENQEFKCKCDKESK